MKNNRSGWGLTKGGGEVRRGERRMGKEGDVGVRARKGDRGQARSRSGGRHTAPSIMRNRSQRWPKRKMGEGGALGERRSTVNEGHNHAARNVISSNCDSHPTHRTL